MGNEEKPGLMEQTMNLLDQAKQAQKNAGNCTVCQKNLLGIPFMAINDTDGSISKICQDCQIKAAVKYIKDYKKSLKGGESGI